MNLHWPQITILSLYAVALAIAMLADGTPKTGTNRFSHHLFGVALNAWLLWMGGFFS